jgi:hypothetical protein
MDPHRTEPSKHHPRTVMLRVALATVMTLVVAACDGSSSDATAQAPDQSTLSSIEAPPDTTLESNGDVPSTPVANDKAGPVTTLARPRSLDLVLGPNGLSDTLVFGSDGDEVASAISAFFGHPSRDDVEEFLLLTSPQGDNIWGDAPDGLGLISDYPFYRSVCWDAGLCIEMDSEDGKQWIFVTWEYGIPADSSDPLLTAEGIGVGSTFSEIRAAYPDVTVDWGEGETTGFTLPGWEPAFNGALVGNGMFDFNFNPIAAFGREELLHDDIPDSVTVRSMHAGNGVDYGCC